MRACKCVRVFKRARAQVKVANKELTADGAAANFIYIYNIYIYIYIQVNVANNKLTELPGAVGGLAGLQELNASVNQLAVCVCVCVSVCVSVSVSVSV